MQRKGATLDEVRASVRAEFGAAARIVAAERVTTPGIGGLFRRAHVEATVEVPAPDEVPTARVAIADGAVKRVGIAALLADAEEAEARIAGGDGTASTRADAFASVLDGFVADGIAESAPRPTVASSDGDPSRAGGSRLQAGPAPSGGTGRVIDGIAPIAVAGPVAAARPVPPAVRSADGDLVLLVGRPNDVDAVAGVFATRYALRATDAADRRGASSREPRASATDTPCSASRRGTTAPRSRASHRTRCGSWWTSAGRSRTRLPCSPRSPSGRGSPGSWPSGRGRPPRRSPSTCWGCRSCR
ncbi:hypothetical protein P9139_14085 [Curtobacterium flaccumfaciens]|nr:hypothetical protein P9139_14085 [Curtobacterium flaccumfaciens]